MTMLTLSALLWALGLPPFEAEFQSLFDGQTLTGWVGDTTGYVVRDGANGEGQPICRLLYTVALAVIDP